DEALHEVPSNRHAADRCGEVVVQPVHGLSHRARSEAAVAEGARPRPPAAGSVGRRLRCGDCTDAEGGPWVAVYRDLRGDPSAPPRPGGRRPPHSGAPDPGLAGDPWGRTGGYLPADAR